MKIPQFTSVDKLQDLTVSSLVSKVSAVFIAKHVT